MTKTYTQAEVDQMIFNAVQEASDNYFRSITEAYEMDEWNELSNSDTRVKGTVSDLKVKSNKVDKLFLNDKFNKQVTSQIFDESLLIDNIALHDDGRCTFTLTVMGKEYEVDTNKLDTDQIIATTRRETVEGSRKILRERLKELHEANADFDYTNGFREALDIFDLVLDQLPDKQEV